MRDAGHATGPAPADAGAFPEADTPPGAPGLNLDARQRAMLEEMGVRVWWPGPPAETTAPAVLAGAAAAGRVQRPAPAAGEHTLPKLHPPSGSAVPAAPRHAAPSPSPVARPQPGADLPAAPAPGGWSLQAPQPLFPGADPQRTPAALGAGWLIVVEGRAGSDPLAGDAGRLLENMLRALQLHHHPRAFVCLLDAPLPSEAPGPGGLEALQSAVAAVRPAVLLLLGRTVARVLLGRSEPLGQLRSAPLQVAGVPTVVGYDTPYLLRAQQAKAQAWADLCRARALAGASRTKANAAPPNA